MEKPIPAFYCCYLLRSTVRHASLYVGSTPNPPRRLKQHNGFAPGGAKRTSMKSLKPWEMSAIVTGFPSKIAALQFEWAWQHTYRTRHLTKAERERRGNGRARSLPAMLSDLHLLLRVKSFERWPLHIRFFAQDVYKVWQSLGARLSMGIRDDINITFTPPEPISTDHGVELGPDHARGIGSFDLGYNSTRSLLEKSLVSFGPNAPKLQCTKCKESIDSTSALGLVCPETTCKGVWHMRCLSQELLAQEGHRDTLIPIKGACPVCSTEVEWSTLMKDLSLRGRGQKEIARLFKQKSVMKGTPRSDLETALATALATVVVSEEGVEDAEDEDDVDGISAKFAICQGLTEDFEDDWIYRADDDDDISSVADDSSTRQRPHELESKRMALGPIVEESDWGDAEVLE